MRAVRRHSPDCPPVGLRPPFFPARTAALALGPPLSLTLALALGLALALASPAQARRISLDTAETVARNFMARQVVDQGEWAGSTQPDILTRETIVQGGIPVGYNFAASPRGHVLVPADDALPPVKLASDESSLSFGLNGEGDEEGSCPELRAWLTGSLYASIKAIDGFDAPPAVRDPAMIPVMDGLWQLLTTDPILFMDALRDYKPGNDPVSSGPLAATAWSQNAPYNLHCPESEQGCKTRAGSAAMALSQVMRRHAYPKKGQGERSYSWQDGKRTATLRRDFSESWYYWEHMPKSISSSSSENEQNAVSGLVIDAAIALSTQFGCESSKASILQAPEALKEYFGYMDSVSLVTRADMNSDQEWLETMAGEFEAGRPILFEISGQNGETLSAMADGFRNLPGRIHINMALDRNYRGWLAMDNLQLERNNPYDVRNQKAVIAIAKPVIGPRPISPEPNATVFNATRLFAWEEPPGSENTHYNLWIKGDEGVLADDWFAASDVCAEGKCQTPPSADIPAPGPFVWTVRGFRDESGQEPGPWSEIQGFTARAPETPTPLSPTGNQTSGDPTFVWSMVDGALGYTLRVEQGNETSTAKVQSQAACQRGNCSQTLHGMAKGAYAWSVQATGIGDSEFSAPLEFQVLRASAGNESNGSGAWTATNGGPIAPILTAPANESLIRDDRPEFRWAPSPNATAYLLTVVGPFGLAARPMNASSQEACNASVCAARLNATLDPDGLYLWSVQARSDEAAGQPSPLSSFTVSTDRNAEFRFPASPPETSTLGGAARRRPAPVNPVGTKAASPGRPGFLQPSPVNNESNANPNGKKRTIEIRKRGADEPDQGNSTKKPLLRITS